IHPVRIYGAQTCSTPRHRPAAADPGECPHPHRARPRGPPRLRHHARSRTPDRRGDPDGPRHALRDDQAHARGAAHRGSRRASRSGHGRRAAALLPDHGARPPRAPGRERPDGDARCRGARQAGVSMSWLERFYALALYLYPPSFRRDHGHEMRQVLRATVARERTAAVAARLIADLVRSVPREWADATHRRSPPSPAGHDARHGEPMRNLLRDLRYGARLLRRSPGFTLAAVVTLALGIGANTAMVSLANATLLRPLPVANADELFVVPWSSAYLDFRDYRDRLDVFSGVAAAGGGASQVALSIDGPNELTRVAFVSGNLFTVLGVAAAIGRTLQDTDETNVAGGINAVLAYDFWALRFGSDPSVVGRTIRLNARPVTVVGVAARGFRGISLTSNPRMYLPLTASPHLETGFFAREGLLQNRGFVWLRVVGRLRPGVTP